MSYLLAVSGLTDGTELLLAERHANYPGLPTAMAIRATAPAWPTTLPVDLAQPILRAVISVCNRSGDATPRQSWLGFWCGNRANGTISWQEGHGLSPPRIVIWADLDAFCVWGEHGEGISLSAEFPDVPGIEALDHALQVWAWPYDQAYVACQGVQAEMNMDWDLLNAKGLALAHQLKSLVGERAVVFFEKAPFDATRPREESLLVE